LQVGAGADPLLAPLCVVKVCGVKLPQVVRYNGVVTHCEMTEKDNRRVPNSNSEYLFMIIVKVV
jgi:hypothetical protein